MFGNLTLGHTKMAPAPRKDIEVPMEMKMLISEAWKIQVDHPDDVMHVKLGSADEVEKFHKLGLAAAAQHGGPFPIQYRRRSRAGVDKDESTAYFVLSRRKEKDAGGAGGVSVQGPAPVKKTAKK